MINGCIKETLTVLIRWWVNGIEPDCATVASMLPVYSYSKELEVGRRVHALVEMVNVPLWKAVLHVQPQENAACCESQGGTLTVPIFPTTSRSLHHLTLLSVPCHPASHVHVTHACMATQSLCKTLHQNPSSIKSNLKPNNSMHKPQDKPTISPTFIPTKLITILTTINLTHIIMITNHSSSTTHLVPSSDQSTLLLHCHWHQPMGMKTQKHSFIPVWGSYQFGGNAQSTHSPSSASSTLFSQSSTIP